MECVILIGIPASGKSTFCKETLYQTHIRINLDMLKTRHREQLLVKALLQAKQPFVVDNTNPTADDRRKYIQPAKEHHFRVVGYYFEPNYKESVIRNEARTGKEKVPEVGIASVMKKLQPPELAEGFDELYRVRTGDGRFLVDTLDWREESTVE